MDRFGHTQERLAEALGKSRSHIANLLRLLTLPEPVLELLRAGRLTAGHARALVTATNPEALARQVVERDLSVRQTEALARAAAARPARRAPAPRPAAKDADTRALEEDLTANLRLKVTHRAPAGPAGGRAAHPLRERSRSSTGSASCCRAERQIAAAAAAPRRAAAGRRRSPAAGRRSRSTSPSAGELRERRRRQRRAGQGGVAAEVDALGSRRPIISISTACSAGATGVARGDAGAAAPRPPRARPPGARIASVAQRRAADASAGRARRGRCRHSRRSASRRGCAGSRRPGRAWFEIS